MNNALEPRRLAHGWLPRTQRAAWRHVRKRAVASVALTVGPTSLILLFHNTFVNLLVIVFAMFATYWAFAPRKRTRADIPTFLVLLFPTSLLGVVHATLPFTLRGPAPAAELLIPIIHYSACALVVLSFSFWVGSVGGTFTTLVWQPSESAPLRYQFLFFGPFSLVLYSDDTNLDWWQCFKLGERGGKLNNGQFWVLTVPVIVFGLLPPLLPFFGAWFFAMYREIFFGPTAASVKAPAPARVSRGLGMCSSYSGDIAIAGPIATASKRLRRSTTID